MPLDGYSVAQGSLGAIARNISAPGAYRVATLTLNVAAVPGTHRLWPAYGSYSTAPAASAAELQPGPAFVIHVGELWLTADSPDRCACPPELAIASGPVEPTARRERIIPGRVCALAGGRFC